MPLSPEHLIAMLTAYEWPLGVQAMVKCQENGQVVVEISKAVNGGERIASYAAIDMLADRFDNVHEKLREASVELAGSEFEHDNPIENARRPAPLTLGVFGTEHMEISCGE
jgi:hypothetical protein